MQRYERGFRDNVIETRVLSIDLRSNVLEHAVGLAVLSLLWGIIFYLSLSAALG